MAFPIESPFNTPPPGAVTLFINLASRREITVHVSSSHVDKIMDGFLNGEPFFITSVTDPITGKFTRVAVNPNLVEFIKVVLEEPEVNENVRSIQRVRAFNPESED